MAMYHIPGVYPGEVIPTPVPEFLTGVPAFFGIAEKGPESPQIIRLWPDFMETFGGPPPASYLAYTVRGFFENGGQICYIVRLPESTPEALDQGLETIAPLNSIDLVCAPDIMMPQKLSESDLWLPPENAIVQEMQASLLEHCDEVGNRFAILDSHTCANIPQVLEQGEKMSSTNGALYYPWILVSDGPERLRIAPLPQKCETLERGLVPPCGHIAGIYARIDQSIGVHKAPANEIVAGALDLQLNLTTAEQSRLMGGGSEYPRVNYLRSLPGRGIRIWTACTLSRMVIWRYINVRRLFLTVGRWIERNLAGVVFEPNDPRLWARIERELSTYFDTLLQQGALQGATAEEAYYVKCDAETNPRENRNIGELVTEIGLAAISPYEFIIVRIIHAAGGVAIAGVTEPGS